MREKKFRKITEKNISSIYGKILNIRKKWICPNMFVIDSIDRSCCPGIPIPKTTFVPGVDREAQRILSEKMKIALEDQDQFLASGKGVNLDTFKGFVSGIGSKPEPMKPLPNFPYFTENDLSSMENVLYLRQGI